MHLKDVIEQIEVWEDWHKRYNYFVPRFVEEATSKNDWSEWDKDIFYEFFERSYNQCISSLRQGYFTNEEKGEIKNRWKELSPNLKRIAESQNTSLWNVYEEIQKLIRECTDVNRKAATYRLIASLQPNLLCTVVNEHNLAQIYNYLRQYINDKIPDQSFNWYIDSNQLWQLYKDCFPEKDPKELVTYPWQTKVFFEEEYKSDNDMSEENNLKEKAIELLKYKKQIILQGPPGTGKTRLAKEIAKQLTNLSNQKYIVDEIDDEIIRKILRAGLSIKTVAGSASYDIVELQHDRIKSTKNSGTPDDTLFGNIKSAFLQKLWTKTSDDNPTRRASAFAYYIYEQLFKLLAEKGKEQVKIIQFHPSYSYEDFVRGIVAESKRNQIEYKNVNKVLGKFAEKAKKDWDDSRKDVADISKEKRLKEYFEQFVDKINDQLADGITILKLTNSVSLVGVESDAFRYNGNDEWTTLGNRMLFKDILQAFLDGNKERQDIKRNINLSGLAKQHASYFVRVLNMFQEFIVQNNLNFKNLNSEKPPLENFVLIIDEINRANLSAVLGELIYALEYRGEEVDSIYAIEGDNTFILPPNLYIIGTMNTADRSVGHIDYAIRRRFAFVDVFPKDLSSELADAFNKNLYEKVASLFDTHLSPEFEKKDVQLGHSYFIDKSDEGGTMAVRLEYEIKPILREYVKDGILVGTDIKEEVDKLSVN